MKPGGYEIRLDATFAALADPTRRAILARLAGGEASVTVLERAGLVSRSRDAQRRPCKIVAEPLAEATRWLARYRELWEERYQRLDDVLDDLKALEKKRPRKKEEKR